MFGFIRKKRLEKEILRLMVDNDTEKACNNRDFYYRCGNVDALNALIYLFGLDFSKVKYAKKSGK